MAGKPKTATEAQWAKALTHPLRGRILQKLSGRIGSPGDLAAELGAPLGVVSYHIRMLRNYGMVELVRTEPRRGALKHFYRATKLRGAPGLPELLTQLAAMFGVTEDSVRIHVTEEPGVRTYEVQVQEWAENLTGGDHA